MKSDRPNNYWIFPYVDFSGGVIKVDSVDVPGCDAASCVATEERHQCDGVSQVHDHPL